MIFYVAYSAEARQDLRDIYEYIAYELLVPETAAGQWLHCSERVATYSILCSTALNFLTCSIIISSGIPAALVIAIAAHTFYGIISLSA